jgi:hypothetical protein
MRVPSLFPLLALVALIAACLAWHTYKRPSLLLCTIALMWVLLEFVAEPLVAIAALSPNLHGDVIGVYCAQLLGTVAGLGGIRGAWATRRCRQLAPKDAV